MDPRTEEFLYSLLRIIEFSARPSWLGANESFEGWAYRRGYLRRIRELQERRFIEITKETGGSLRRVVILTEAGRLQALGGRDPEKLWARDWDGLWRFVIFDLPAREVALRQKLWRFLTSRHFGWLQRSVWLSPDPGTEVKSLLSHLPGASSVLVCLEGRGTAGESDAELVRRAWNFAEINRRYRTYLEILDEPPSAKGEDLSLWKQREWRAWRHAIRIDPLLPLILHPSDYLGPRAWTKRRTALAKLPRPIQPKPLSQL